MNEQPTQTISADRRRAAAVEMYVAGVFVRDIKKALHIDSGTVNRFVTEAGHALRGIGNWTHGPDRPRPPMHTPESFWALVDKTGECWKWTGCVDGFGYGIIRYRGRAWKAHRLAYTFTNGSIPQGKFICHHCDNPPCVNPAHLYAGTQLDNMRDRDRRGRGDWSKSATGERHSQAKLTWEQVGEIRRRCASGSAQRSLAFEYGVSPSTIHRIVHNELWVA
jgi:hypothetical protein